MKTKIIKLDKRYNGHEYFSFMATPQNKHVNMNLDTVIHITEMRQWCWETFGPSCELSEYSMLVLHDMPVNPHWCWRNASQFRGPRILLATESDRNWFVIRWG